MLKNNYSFLLFMLLGLTLVAQTNKSGMLLQLNKSEYKNYTSFYSQNIEFDSVGDKVARIDSKKTYVTSSFNYYLGVDSFLDIGIDATYRIAKSDSLTRNGLVNIGPKIRFQPSGKHKNIIIQSTLLIPTIQNLEGTPFNNLFLDFDSYQFMNQLFINKQLLQGLSLFVEFDVLARIDREFEKKTEWIFPTKLFLSTYPFKGATLYVMGEYSNSSFNTANIKGYYIQNGAGFKYQPFKGFEFEIGYSKFHTGKNTGAGSNFAFGIKYLN